MGAGAIPWTMRSPTSAPKIDRFRSLDEDAYWEVVAIDE